MFRIHTNSKNIFILIANCFGWGLHLLSADCYLALWSRSLGLNFAYYWVFSVYFSLENTTSSSFLRSAKSYLVSKFCSHFYFLDVSLVLCSLGFHCNYCLSSPYNQCFSIQWNLSPAPESYLWSLGAGNYFCRHFLSTQAYMFIFSSPSFSYTNENRFFWACFFPLNAVCGSFYISTSNSNFFISAVTSVSLCIQQCLRSNVRK